MAARAIPNFDSATPVRNFVTMLGDMTVSVDRPNLQTAAIRNSYGQHCVDRLTTNIPPAPALVPQAIEVNSPPPLPKPASIDAIDLPAAIRSKALEWQRRQQALVTATNRRMQPGSQVMAWNIVPSQLFQSEIGRFLILACDFHSYGSANTMLLPTMPSGEQQLGLSRHPLVVSEKQLQASQQKLSALRDRVAAENRRAQLALQSGDFSAIYARAESKTKYCKELLQIVNDIATMQLGRGVVETHFAQFGAVIAKM